MKFYYKSPQEVQEDYPGKPEKVFNPFRNRTFWMILADVALLLLIFGIMYKTGSLDSFFPSPTDLKISAEIQGSDPSSFEQAPPSQPLQGQEDRTATVRERSQSMEVPTIRVLLRNDAGQEVLPGEKNNSFRLLSAALRPGPAHSTDFALSEQLELELPAVTLPDRWEAGKVVEFSLEAPANKEKQWLDLLQSSRGAVLMLRFQNINREVKIQTNPPPT